MRLAAVVLFVAGLLHSHVDAAQPTVSVGLAKRDITPTYPIRLSGYNGRTEEATEAETRLWAKAIAIGDGDQMCILVTVDSIGVSEAITSEVAARLAKRLGLRAERLAICASHTHCARRWWVSRRWW